MSEVKIGYGQVDEEMATSTLSSRIAESADFGGIRRFPHRRYEGLGGNDNGSNGRWSCRREGLAICPKFAERGSLCVCRVSHLIGRIYTPDLIVLCSFALTSGCHSFPMILQLDDLGLKGRKGARRAGRGRIYNGETPSDAHAKYAGDLPSLPISGRIKRDFCR